MATSNEQTSNDGNVAECSMNLLPFKTRVAAMVKQLESLKRSLTTTQLAEYDEAELFVRLDYLEKVNETFEKAQSVLEESDGSELEGDGRIGFVSLYFDVKAKLSRQLNVTRKHDMPRSSTFRQYSVEESPICNGPPSDRKTRLPEIHLPKFGGSYTDWPNFFGLFSTVIHDNNDLSNLEKLHHLRSSLCDSALDTISSMEFSDANYEVAVKLLKNRFDNKLLSFQGHVREIFSLRNVENISAGVLRHLSDKLNSHLRAMQTIATKEQIADGFLIYLVTTKLDPKSQMKWEESLAVNELPTWATMAAFLERRCRMLENVENSMVNKAPNQQVPKRSVQSNRHVHVSSATSSPMCSFCDSTEHFINSCSRFGNLSPSLRFKEAKKLKLCLNCLRKGHMLKSCTSGCCRKCSSKHHTMLHIENVSSGQPLSSPTDQLSPTTSQSVLISSVSPLVKKSSSSSVSVLLATAIVLVKNQFGVFVPCRVILDSASQLNLIASRFVNRLQLKCDRAYATISGIGDGSCVIDKSVDIIVKSQHSDYSTSITAMVVPTITDYQPNANINACDWKIPRNIQLADPSFDQCGRIDILIGAELFFELMSVGQIKMADNLPILQKTLFGWVVAGGSCRTRHSWSLAVACKEDKGEEGKLSSIVKSFWEVENNFESSDPFSSEERFCEDHFLKNTVRLTSGAYSVRLPQVDGRDARFLGDSYERALQRFKSLERKFKKHPEIKTQYSTFMSEYATLNHMTLISSQVTMNQYFLPHHCVHKSDSTSTKLRVVFDGSAKTTSGLSLNDVLHAGPSIQPKLFNTLLRYRFFKVALSGDICKMYRCVRVSHPDDYLQCVLWRENEDENINVYKLNTVTYGTKPAAFLAIRAMHQLAADEENRYPLGAKIVKRDFYVDDMISGGDSVGEALLIRRQVAALLARGDFIIRKWCSNIPGVLDGIPKEQCEQFLTFKSRELGEELTPNDIKGGTHLLIKNIQIIHFAAAYRALKDKQNISPSSKLASLMPIMDSFGLIRVGGRLQHSSLDFDARHPIILPQHHPFTASLIMHFHEKLLHAGPQCLTASIRQQYWPIGGRKLVSSITSKCLRCFRMRPVLSQHVMGNLPSDRVTPNKAFHTTGVDFCGPFYYKSEVRKRPPVKCYISIFVCFSTKATHLEVVQDLSTPSFLSALSRFIAIRGKPSKIWSDNATNFVGAKNELADLKQLFLGQSHQQALKQQCLADGIEWKFIPPRSPHFGGLWEAAVKSAKFHFRRAVGLNALTFDELRTLVCQISAILNSRPLCPISEHPDDLEVLTPGHFLIGGPLISIIEPDVCGINLARLNSWQKVCHMQQIFWKKWSTTYLSLLQERSKWRKQSENISRGAMVILKDENHPPIRWQMGRVTDVICGDDGVGRVVIVRTKNGTVKRAVSKVAVLPMDDSVERPSLPTGGEC